MVGKIIEIIVLLLGLLITAAIVVKIPLDSYNAHKDYLAQVEEQMKENEQAAIKPVLESLTVELKEGVKYYANDLADAKVEHFTVTANYVKGEESYTEPVEEGKFTVSTPDDFYARGGDITITYRGVSVKITVELVPVVIETLEVVESPYTVKYAQGTTFDASGMVIQAVYNDGSTKILASDAYSVDTTTALGLSDKEVTVTYGSGENAKTVKVSITVAETVVDGDVKSISVSNAIVNAGDTLDKASMTVIATYESGNRKALSADEYTVSASTEATRFGKEYELTVSYNEDTTKTAKTDVTVRYTLQGEDGVIVGGAKKTETEYVIIDGVITETTNDVTFAGNFSKTVTNGNEGSLTLYIDSIAGTVGNITMRCGNSYLVGAKGNYSMQPLQINTILDLTINGRKVEIPDSVVLKGCGPHADYAPLYGIYYEFTFENVQLDAGMNEVKFSFKKSTVGATNCWGETPSTMNIDYVHFDTLGAALPENYEIAELEITNVFNIAYKQSIKNLAVSVVGTATDGFKMGLDADLYDVRIASGNTEGGYFHAGTYTIEVSLKSNPAVKATMEYTVEAPKSFVVLNCYVELVDGKVYYVFAGNSTGYEAEDFVIFDGTKELKFTASFTDETFVFKCDVTDMAAGTFYPHMKVEGNPYNNGKAADTTAGKNGDVLGHGLTFTNGQSVTLNGKTYTIKLEWEMPTLVVQ